jgi:hypothetical protein
VIGQDQSHHLQYAISIPTVSDTPQLSCYSALIFLSEHIVKPFDAYCRNPTVLDIGQPVKCGGLGHAFLFICDGVQLTGSGDVKSENVDLKFFFFWPTVRQ